MAIQTVSGIIERINSADEGREIAVFKAPFAKMIKRQPVLDAYLSRTVDTQEMIKENAVELVGLFNSTMTRDKVKEVLLDAAAENYSFQNWSGKKFGMNK